MPNEFATGLRVLVTLASFIICFSDEVNAEEAKSYPLADAENIYSTLEGVELGALDVFKDCDVCPEMVVLPLGRFVMGAPIEQSEFLYLLLNKPDPNVISGLAQEGPEHKVEIDIPIAIGRNEVTREEWLVCVAEGGCNHVPDPRIRQLEGFIYADAPRDPVFNVSYHDMIEYVAWLNEKLMTEAYRLPTEAEWEYAARSGTQTRFAQGESLTTSQANIGIFHHDGYGLHADPNNRPGPVSVDTLEASNAWGLRHMAGNVLEMTMSCWSDRHLGLRTSSSYLANALQNSECRRVTKGGAFGAHADYARPANRGSGSETIRSSSGFRIVKEM